MSRITAGTIFLHGLDQVTQGPIDVSTLFTLLGSFRFVNGIDLAELSLKNVTDAFLQRCRDAGMMSLSLNADYDPRGLSVDGIMDFFYGPTRAGLERTDRSLEDVFFFDKAVFRRMLEVRFYTIVFMSNLCYCRKLKSAPYRRTPSAWSCTCRTATCVNWFRS